MKHLVLVVGGYYPNPSPTGQCAHRYISLLKDSYSVDVIYIQSGTEKVNGLKNGDETLYALSNRRLRMEESLQATRKKTKNSIIRHAAGVGVKAVKAFGRVQSLFLFPNNLKWFRGKAYKALCAIHEQNPIDVVFTVSYPFSAHLAGEKFKKTFSDVKWVAYTVDLFHTRHRCWKRALNIKCEKAFTVEKRVLSNADTNFLSEEVYENCPELFADCVEKTSPLPYLLCYNDVQNDKRFDATKINLVYGGRFFKDIRSPEYLLKTFLLVEDSDIILHLFSSSNCEAMIDRYVKKANGRIIKHGMVGYDEIQSVLATADILVSVGNAVAEVKPSKTFEYISTGKPIINFYQNGFKDDVLEKYPNALQISGSRNCDVAAKEVEAFCRGSKGKTTNFKEIDALYPKNSGNNIRKILFDGMEK